VDTRKPRRFQSALLAGDDGRQNMALIRALHEGGFAVLQRPKGPATLELATSGEFDLVLWRCEGMALRDLDAVAAIARTDVPLIAVLEEALPDAVAECLTAGADACLQADAPERVVVAQAHAVLRRRGLAPTAAESLGLLQIGDLIVDLDRCEVERGGEYIPLTASEFRILAYLAKNAGRVLAPHEILNAVSDEYEYRPREAQEVLKVYIRRIRRKLEPSPEEPRYLVTVRGFGYRLEGGACRTHAAPAAVSTA
jgi:DNA-binding response OmpR family regulator